MTNEEFLKKWYETIWIEQDFEAGRAAFIPNSAGTIVAGDLVLPPNDFETLVLSHCRNFTPQSVEMKYPISKGQEISAVIIVHGVRIDNSTPVGLEFCVYRKIVDGKFTSSYSTANHSAFYTAMGQLPEGMVSTLLMGGSLTE